MKVSSTPLNSPSLTFALVGPRTISPTFCQSASVGDPMPTPGIFRIAVRRSSAANARWSVPSTPVVLKAATAPALAAPLRTLRRLACNPSSRLYCCNLTENPPSFEAYFHRPVHRRGCVTVWEVSRTELAQRPCDDVREPMRATPPSSHAVSTSDEGDCQYAAAYVGVNEAARISAQTHFGRLH